MNSESISNVTEYIKIIGEIAHTETQIIDRQNSLIEQYYQKENDSTSASYYHYLLNDKESTDKKKSDNDWNNTFQQNKLNKAFKFYYRGHYKSTYQLIPSVFRESFWEKEDYFYHQIMVECPEHFRFDTHIGKLVTMQHYDCPTRLLDVTSNPLVALYFACKNFSCEHCNDSYEGEVIVFPVRNCDIVYADSDRVLMLSCLPRFSNDEKHDLYSSAIESLSDGKFPQLQGGSRYKKEIVEKFFHEVSTELPSFKREIKPIDILKPIFVQPNKTNGRILKQEGAFILNGLSQNRDEAKDKLEVLVYSRIKVRNQSRILKELEELGINESTLFPEVDKVADYLKSQVK